MNPHIIFALACFYGSAASLWGVDVWSEDFESVELGLNPQTNNDVGNVQPANTLRGIVVEAPAGFDRADGNVLLLSTGTNDFAAIRPSNAFTPINLPPIADGLTWTLSFDIFLPAELDDDVGGIASFRWSDGGANNTINMGDFSQAVLEAGEHHIVYTGTFPIEGANGNEPFLPTNVRPFIRFAQGEVTSDFVYFDNLRFEVEASADDPNVQADGANFGTVVQSEGTYTRPITIMNTGESNPLSVTAAEVIGFDMAAFTIEDPGFPLTIPAGESGTIVVTFDPGDDVGNFIATLNITSNDQGNSVVPIDLVGTVQEPFIGTELIVNGDFEAGDLTGWDDSGNLTFQQAPPARSGMGSALYTTVENQEFGAANLFAEPPFGLEDTPQALTITEEMRGAAYEYSAWYYRPSVNSFGEFDTAEQVSAIFRWNGSQNMADLRGSLQVASIPFNTWVRAVGTGIVPFTGGDGEDTTSVIPIFSFRDLGANNPGGQLIFIDEVSFKVDAPPPTLPIASPVLGDVSINGDGEVVIVWNGLAGFEYSFERSIDLNDWVVIAEGLVAEEGTPETFEDEDAVDLEQARLFYRLRATPSL